MSRIQWNQIGERRFETGVDRGVLFLQNGGVYDEGHPWSGLTNVTESPSGAESSKQYADNIVYLNLISAEEFGATIEAFAYPRAFAQCDGTVSPTPGVTVGQQTRRSFGFAYRTRVGNDTESTDYGYKLHLVYNATAAPSERAYGTINESPEALTFSWELTTTPVEVGEVNGVELKPTAILTIDSTEVGADELKDLEDILYGTPGADPRLPLPAEVIQILSGGTTEVTPALPTYDGASHVITIPTSADATYRIDNVTVPSGPRPALTTGQTKVVKIVPKPGKTFPDNFDDTRSFSF